MAYQNVKTPLVTQNGVPYNLQYDLSNGNVQIIQQNAPPGTTPVYQDGKWNASASTLGFSNAEKSQLHQQVISAVQSAYNSVGGVSSGSKLPQWAAKSFSTGTPGQTSVNPQNSVSGTQGGGGIGNNFGTLTSTLLNPAEAFKNIAVNGGSFGVGNEKNLFGKTMKYPEDLMTSQQDHLSITMYSYKPPNQQSLFGGQTSGFSIVADGLQRNTTLESKIGTVILPMPQSVSDNNAVSWGDDTMSNLAAGVTADTVGRLAAKGGAAAVAGLVGGALGMNMKETASMFLQGENFFNLVSKGKISQELASLATSDITSKLVKAQGYGVESESILARGSGVVPNSNLELLFNSPVLRAFSFSYRVSPRSAEEAAMVRRIIRFFKQGMAAKKKTGQSGQASFFLGTPNVFKLEYRTGTRGIDGVNKFKTCALTDFSCNYTPEGIWAAYDSGQPVSTVFSMTFKELEPIYDTDYQSNNIFNGLGSELSSINANSVGY